MPKKGEWVAVWDPHKLSTKLCRLFDSGVTSVDEFARRADLPPHFIEDVCNKPGIRINREIEFQIGRALAAYLRENPDLYRAIDAPPESKRRVEEVVLRSKDWRGFEIINSDGRCLMYVEWPRKDTTQARIDGLWRWLDKEDPQPQLRIV